MANLSFNIIKRSGEEVEFDASKIINAISKANAEVPETARIKSWLIEGIAKEIEEEASSLPHAMGVEEIQDRVQFYLVRHGAYVVENAYSKYRHMHELLRKKNTTDDQIMALVELNNGGRLT